MGGNCAYEGCGAWSITFLLVTMVIGRGEAIMCRVRLKDVLLCHQMSYLPEGCVICHQLLSLPEG